MHMSVCLHRHTETLILLSATAVLCMVFFWLPPRPTSFRAMLLQFKIRYLGERCSKGNSLMDTKLIYYLEPKYSSPLEYWNLTKKARGSE